MLHSYDFYVVRGLSRATPAVATRAFFAMSSEGTPISKILLRHARGTSPIPVWVIS